MSYYPEQDSHIRDKVKVVLELSNYATEKESKDARGVDTSNLAICFEILTKIESNKLVNVPTGLNISKTKVDDLDLGKLKTVPIDLKKLSDVV